MHTLTKTSNPKDHRKLHKSYSHGEGVIYQTHYFEPILIENETSIDYCYQNEHSLEDYLNDIQEWFELSDMEKSELSNYDIVQIHQESLDLFFKENAPQSVKKIADLIIPKIQAIQNNLTDITYMIYSYIEYDDLHEVFNWVDTRTDDEILKGIDKDEEVPWSNQDLLEYEAPKICDSFNKKYGTNLDADFINSIKPINYGLYEFKVNRKKLLASYHKKSK